MSKSDVKFVHKEEDGLYKVWVYLPIFNGVVDFYQNQCDASNDRLRAKIYEKAKEIYEEKNKPKVEWESAI